MKTKLSLLALLALIACTREADRSQERDSFPYACLPTWL